MLKSLTSQAINTALRGDWQTAVKLNSIILKQDKRDVEAMLRLARAYEELGKVNEAKRYYNKTLKIDKFNPIAKRSLIRLREYGLHQNDHPMMIKSDFFLEEPGITKTVNLIKLAPPKALLQLNTAEELIMMVGKYSICFRNSQNCYLGRLPDDISQRLIRLIQRGNRYLTLVKAVDTKILQVFIKEIKKSKRNIDIPSFVAAAEQYHSFLPQEAIKEET